MVHFATRFVAHGVLGPFGGIVARIFFSYRKPKPYQHHEDRLPVGKIVAVTVAAIAIVSVIVVVAERAGLLHAVGIAAAAFLLRVVAMSSNFLLWRQLSPIVGAPKKSRSLADEISAAAQGEDNGRPLRAESAE